MHCTRLLIRQFSNNSFMHSIYQMLAIWNKLRFILKSIMKSIQLTLKSSDANFWVKYLLTYWQIQASNFADFIPVESRLALFKLSQRIGWVVLWILQRLVWFQKRFKLSFSPIFPCHCVHHSEKIIGEIMLKLTFQS